MPANYVLLGTQTVGNGGAASVTFSNIPQTGYTDLKIVTSARLTSTDSPIKVNFNGVTTGYSWRRIYGSGSAASTLSGTDAYFLHANTTSTTASTFSNAEFLIPNYTSSDYKAIEVNTALETNATGGELFMLAALWSNASAISSINLTPLTANFAAGSTFYLYGLAAVGTTPAIAPFASGGDVIANDGTYWYHAFKTTGAFVPAKALSCDVLVVAGGGGGSSSGGAGGAGGLVYASSKSFSASSFTATIGAGGTPTTSGANTTISDITALGGGSGGGEGSVGVNGGSGGGGGGTGSTFAGGSATQGTSGGGTGYGNAGGSGLSNYQHGGGGGAGAAGGNGVTGSRGGNGGVGLNTWSSFASATATGVSGYFAGGGGGGGYLTAGGTGGSGGGGNGAPSGSAATAGTANTGGGGGSSAGGGGTGSAGGSGIIIIRYAMA